MSKERITGNEHQGSVNKPARDESTAYHRAETGEQSALTSLQQQVGNRAVQRWIAQRRSGEGAYELDDDTAGRINSLRGGGQALDASVQTQMSAATGGDYSGVRVHTSGEAHELNEQVNAEAFTTGSDIFFRAGAYQPNTSSGQELLAHELSHVDQQRAGRVGGGGGKMTVNAPDDTFEKEADAVANQVTNSGPAPSMQRATMPDEEEPVQGKLQRQELPEEREEEMQTKRLQRSGVPEEEELVQGKLQRQEIPEDRADQAVG